MSTEREEQVINTCYTTIHTLDKQKDKKQKRVQYMKKDGKFPVMFLKAPGDWSTYFVDIFTTLIEIRWRVMFLIFFLSNIISWFLFGLGYWLIAYVNGDTESLENKPCVENVRGFTGAFLFSVETQATIGYGFRYMNEYCIVAIVVVTVQDLFSCFLDTIIIGIVLAKMASARKRAQTVGFSKFAVVNLRDGVLCLSWRLGDFRGNHILEGVVTAQLVRCMKRPQGFIAWSYQDLQIEEPEIALTTPVTIIHKLEPGSPLYSLDPDELLEENFDLVVSFTYTGDSTGMLHQTRTIYTPADIRWGQRFKDILNVGKKHYKVDYAFFNKTTWVPVPMLSAEALNRKRHPDDGHLPSVKRKGGTGHVTLEITEEPVLQTFL